MCRLTELNGTGGVEVCESASAASVLTDIGVTERWWGCWCSTSRFFRIPQLPNRNKDMLIDCIMASLATVYSSDISLHCARRCQNITVIKMQSQVRQSGARSFSSVCLCAARHHQNLLPCLFRSTFTLLKSMISSAVCKWWKKTSITGEMELSLISFTSQLWVLTTRLSECACLFWFHLPTLWIS